MVVRLAQQLPRYIGIQCTGIKFCDFCFQERKLLLFYLHALRLCRTLIIVLHQAGVLYPTATVVWRCTVFRLEVSYNLLGQGLQTLVDYLSQNKI